MLPVLHWTSGFWFIGYILLSVIGFISVRRFRWPTRLYFPPPPFVQLRKKIKIYLSRYQLSTTDGKSIVIYYFELGGYYNNTTTSNGLYGRRPLNVLCWVIYRVAVDVVRGQMCSNGKSLKQSNQEILLFLIPPSSPPLIEIGEPGVGYGFPLR